MYRVLVSTVAFFFKTAPLVVLTYSIVWYSHKRGYLLKFLRHLESLAKLMRLNSVAFTSFTLSFFSIVASYTFLSQAWKDGKLRDRDVIGISLLNSYPSAFNHLYTFYIPFVIPLLGYVGVIYTLIRIGVAFVKTVVGYFLVSRDGSDYGGVEKKLNLNVFENLGKILITLFVTYFAVELLYYLGLFDEIVGKVGFLPLNPSALTIALVAIFNTRSAIVVTADLIEKGLSFRWALAGLILGNVVSFSVRSARHSLPLHISLFGRLGFKVVFVNSLLTLAIDSIVLAVLLI